MAPNRQLARKSTRAPEVALSLRREERSNDCALRTTELCLGSARRDHDNCKARREVQEEHDKLLEAVPAVPEETPRTSTEGAEAAQDWEVREAETAELQHDSSRTARSQLPAHIYACCLNLCGT